MIKFNIFLYNLLIVFIPFFYIIFCIVYANTKKNILFSIKLFNLIVLISFITLVSFIFSIHIGKIITHELVVDLTNIFCVLLPFIIPYILFYFNPDLNFNLIFKLYVLVFLISIITTKIFNFSFVIIPSTINYSTISIISFHYLYLFYDKRKYFSLILAIICFIITLFSLAKWLFIYQLLFILIILNLIYSAKNKLLIFVFFISFLLFFIIFKNIIFDLVFISQGFDNFNEFIDNRIVGDISIRDIDIGFLSIFSNIGIRDGSRLPMWFDLLSRSWDSPLFGVGLGSRAFDYYGFDVEDHNFIIFFISRFGIPFSMYFLYKYLKLINYCILQLGVFDSTIKRLFIFLVVSILFQGLTTTTYFKLIPNIALGMVFFTYFKPFFLLKFNEKKIT